MKILILNWRDIKNSAGGGAEQLTHEMAKRWVGWGHNVIQISAGFPGSRKKETVDGVKIIRLGKWWTVHLLAFFYYLKNLRGKIDVIVDEVHWFPFFTALYARRKTVLLACEVAKNHFFTYFSRRLASFWRLLEKFYLLLYRNLPAITISSSTKNDLIKEGFKEEKITVLPMGVSLPKKIRKHSKEKKPTVIFLGRINKLKGIEDAIEAFKLIQKEIPEAQFWVVGSGLPDYEREIKQKVAGRNFKTAVKFWGFVSEKKKFELLSKAHILIVPSVHEGWCLVVIEANAMGTPVVVYNVAGLRDSTKNGFSGLICSKNTPENLAKKGLELLRDKPLYEKLQENALQWSKKFSWDKTAQQGLKALKKVANP